MLIGYHPIGLTPKVCNHLLLLPRVNVTYRVPIQDVSVIVHSRARRISGQGADHLSSLLAVIRKFAILLNVLRHHTLQLSIGFHCDV